MQAERDAIQIEDEEQVSGYAELQQQEAESRSLIRSMVMQPRYALPFLQPGRLARVLTSTKPASGVPQDPDAALEVDPQSPFPCLLLVTPLLQSPQQTGPRFADATDWTGCTCLTYPLRPPTGAASFSRSKMLVATHSFVQAVTSGIEQHMQVLKRYFATEHPLSLCAMD